MDSLTAVTIFFAGLIAMALVVGVVALGLAARLAIETRRAGWTPASQGSPSRTRRPHLAPHRRLTGVGGH
jgi:hypothetical protein